MGDKSPKSKDKHKKQHPSQKGQKRGDMRGKSNPAATIPQKRG